MTKGIISSRIIARCEGGFESGRWWMVFGSQMKRWRDWVLGDHQSNTGKIFQHPSLDVFLAFLKVQSFRCCSFIPIHLEIALQVHSSNMHWFKEWRQHKVIGKKHCTVVNYYNKTHNQSTTVFRTWSTVIRFYFVQKIFVQKFCVKEFSSRSTSIYIFVRKYTLYNYIRVNYFVLFPQTKIFLRRKKRITVYHRSV